LCLRYAATVPLVALCADLLIPPRVVHRVGQSSGQAGRSERRLDEGAAAPGDGSQRRGAGRIEDLAADGLVERADGGPPVRGARPCRYSQQQQPAVRPADLQVGQGGPRARRVRGDDRGRRQRRPDSLAAAARPKRGSLRHLFPYLPQQPGYNKRLRAASVPMLHCIRVLAASTSLWTDDVWVVDSTPVECGRSRETAKRSDLGGWAEYGYCPSHSRWYWGSCT
jgi:hypothetical protein